MREKIIKGKLWVLTDEKGRLIEDIDTDQIYHNAYLHITEISQMGQYAFGNLKGWEDFPKKAGEGDIIVAGRNFGAGSSRQQAVDCFLSLKIGAIIAPSFSPIYFRNAVNSGLAILRCSELPDLVAKRKLENGDLLTINLEAGEAVNNTKKITFSLEPMNPVQLAIYFAGNLFNYGREIGRAKK
ncbi:MAG: 3-isopropylmalate dehydratase [Candidatus Aminicenantes bacterium]|nr:3-isopropylmalate dehydratase [Candidatus Aminicenantes bacterium]